MNKFSVYRVRSKLHMLVLCVWFCIRVTDWSIVFWKVVLVIPESLIMGKKRIVSRVSLQSIHRCLCRVKNMLTMYLKYHKARLTPTTPPVTSTSISPVKMSIGHKSLTNWHSEMIFLQGKSVFYIFLPSIPPYWQIILRFCCYRTAPGLQKGK